MLQGLKPIKAIGLEWISGHLQGADISLLKGKPVINKLFSLAETHESNHVKQLYNDQPFLATSLGGDEVLIRSLSLPLTKEKDIAAAIAFQIETLLPYPIEQATFARQTLSQSTDETVLTVLSARKDFVQRHIDFFQQFHIEPEKISCVQSALCQFGNQYIPVEKTYIIVHANEKLLTGVLIKEGKILAAYSHAEGIVLPLEESKMKRLQQACARIYLALCKEAKGQQVEGVLLAGMAALTPAIMQANNITLLNCGENSEEKQLYAVSIGLAYEVLLQKEAVDFRQQELAYPHPWKRIKVPLATYLGLMLVATAAFYFFGKHYLQHQENDLKQRYVELLAAMSKPYENFETAFLAKHPQAHEKMGGEVVNALYLDQQDLLERLEFLHKDLQATPDSFPLFANIPRVSDVLGWLSNHALVVEKTDDGSVEPRLQLESFSYTMLKRPAQGKKQDKYQVKVEMEFSSPTPKWAREFHDALIAPNDIVDPKGEVKWSSNRGRYRTSFYLKDKTIYPSQ